MENFFFPDSGTNSSHPFFLDNEVYSRRPFFSDSSPFFADSGTYSHSPFLPDTGASFFPDTGIYPRRPFADDKHRSTKPNRSAAKHQSEFADNDRSRSRCDTSVPVHYANDKHRSATKHQSNFADRSRSRYDTSVPVHYANDKHWSTTKHQSDFADNDRPRSSYDTSVPVHYANDKHRTDFADHKHRSTDDSVPIHYAGNKHRSDFADHKHRSDYADHKYRSMKSDRSAAAIKIQKIVRGFLVRKDMQRVRKITAEMTEIGHQISALKFCDNAKQRLWIGEMLMALLLRLDAVRGVREYRKKVVRRVIQFQEAVDSIAQGRSVETADSAEIYTGAIVENTTIEEVVEDGGEIEWREINRESFGVAQSIEDSMEKSLHMAEVTPSERAEESIAIKEVIERAAAENEAMKRMVEELCERSQQQCDLLSSLVWRVEHLESRVQDMEQREKEAKIQITFAG